MLFFEKAKERIMIDVKNSAPMKMLKKYNYLYPPAWKFAEDIAADREYKDKWPHEYVFIPIEAGLELALDRNLHKEQMENIADAVAITCLAAWRKTKLIYDFDATLTEELYKQAKVNIELDTSMLAIPAYSIYIRPNDGAEYDGFFVFFDFDRGHFEFRILVVNKKGNVILPIYLIIPESGSESIDKIIENMVKQFDEVDLPAVENEDEEISGEVLRSFYKNGKRTISRWINLVLYLSAVNADIKHEKRHFFRRSRKIKDIPREVELLNVGETVGVKIRELRQSAQYENTSPQGEYHKSPAMHIRRAHWHTFLYGEKKGKRMLKWLPPIIVNDSGKDFITVTNVKKK